jgi:hypothetical protein
VSIQGGTSVGNAITSNSIYQNTSGAIALVNGANGGQPAPSAVTATLVDSQSKIRVVGTVSAVDSYSGLFLVQVFTSPESDAGNVQARQLLGSFTTAAGSFSQDFAVQNNDPWITVTTTPVTAPMNTSELSTPVELS